MLFNSYTFIIFFAVVLFLHKLPLKWGIKKTNLLFASYLFYAAWNPPFVILIWFATIVSWFVAKNLNSVQDKVKRSFLLIVGIVINLGVLSYFKYGQFLLDNFTWLLGFINVRYQASTSSIILPLGISFYIFKVVSYLIDNYRKQIETQHSFLDFALYVAFFPQILAGPIMRAPNFLSQCVKNNTKNNMSELGWGFSLILLGIFEKNVIADAVLAPIADNVYSSNNIPTFMSAWTSTLAFSGQIFCDFAGYSTAAIGIALCLGFDTPNNFKFPYAAIGFSDFWKRWHITLSSWFRDYLYIPLGGNRGNLIRTQINLMLTMLLCGLWHGASWTFVIWGGFHGLYLIFEKLLKAVIPATPIWSALPVKIFLAFVTFVLVCFGWVFFNAKTFDHAVMITKSMVGINVGSANIQTLNVILTIVVTISMLVIHWMMRDRSLKEVAEAMPLWFRGFVLALLIISIVICSGDDRAFIYFQF